MDIREKIREDRGLIKKLELAIPGFRGYRKREDLRISDSLLRRLLVKRLKDISVEMEECRRIFTAEMELPLLDDVGRIMNGLDVITNRIEHAEQGYSGISADYKIEEEELNTLYEWDLSLLENIEKIQQKIKNLKEFLKNNNKDKISRILLEISSEISAFNQLFDKRISIIADLEVNNK